MINHLEHSEKFAYNIQIKTVSKSDFEALVRKKNFNHDKTNIWIAREMYLGRSGNLIWVHLEKFGALMH